MLRFDRTKDPVPGFSLDRRDLVVRRTFKRREWRLIMTLPLALVALAIFIQYLMGYAALIHKGPIEPVIVERVPTPTPPPRLADAPPLPDAEAIAKDRPIVQELLADRAEIRHDDALDGLTMAWAEALLTSDRTSAPIPQQVLARDLVFGGINPGGAVAIHGRLIDSVAAPIAGGETWQRLAIELDEQQIVQVLAGPEAAELVIGRPVQAVARYLGFAPLPTGTEGNTLVPLLAARAIKPDNGAAADLVPDLADMRTGIPGPIDAKDFANVSDERSVLEMRPYYLLLGQAKADLGIAPDRTISGAVNGNAEADAIHQDPSAARGKPFTVTGFVYRTWQDVNVSRDQPYGLTKVTRVLMWNRDFGAVTEIIDGKKHIKSQILRLYELCLIGDQPVPERGAQIQADCRFFKFRAIPVQADSLRDSRNNVHRQSDYVYTFTFVGSGYREIPPPPPYEPGWFDAITLVLAGGIALLIFILRRRDYRQEALTGPQIRRLRESRRKLDRAAVLANTKTAPATETPAAPTATALPASPTTTDPAPSS